MPGAGGAFTTRRLSWATRLSSRRLARGRARSGDSRVRAGRDPHLSGAVLAPDLLATVWCGVLGHLGALVPGQRAAQLLWQRDDRGGDRVPDRLSTVPGQGGAVVHSLSLPGHRREIKEHREAA